MNIGIDARFLGAQGAGRYIANMIRELQVLDGENRYFVYCAPGNAGIDLESERWQKRIFPETPILGYAQLWLDPAWRGLDLFWATNQILPRACPNGIFKILTVHDLVSKLYPETMAQDNYLMYSKRFDESVRRADCIVTGSDATRRALGEMLRVPPEKVSVIPYGVDPAFAPQDRTSAARYIADKYGVAENYICTLGTLEPRKDHVTLVRAMKILRSRGRLTHQLVIGGGPGWKNEQVYASIEACGLGEREVKFIGKVPDADLPTLYSGAALFAFPSLYEGFGFPLLEAMACGTPVVSSDAPAMPEVAGGAAILVSCGQPEEFANAMSRVLDDPALRQDLIDKGLRRAQDFRWTTAAHAILKVFERACADPAHPAARQERA